MIRTHIIFSSLLQTLLILLTPCLLDACAIPVDHGQVKRQESLYDRVIRTGKIRCAYINYFPNCIKDPNTGKLSGTGIETIELISKKLGLTPEWTEEVGWGTMLEGLQTGRYDLVASLVWTNANRAKLAGFSNPLYYSPVYVYVRQGDRRFKEHQDKINSPSVTVVTIDGETAQIIADAEFPKARRLSLPQMTDLAQVLLSLATKKADVAMTEPIIAESYLKNNPATIENLYPHIPIRVFPNCFMFNRGEFEFKAMLDAVLDEVINSGAMDKILSKYEKVPHQLYRVALPYELPK